jgi:uncharacterized protein (TIGR02186 family)
MRRFLGAVAVLLALCAPAHAVRLISQLSNDNVEITSSFSGERLSFFGTIAPDAGSNALEPGPYHVVVTVLGPTQDRVAREMTHNFGVWLNTGEVRFADFPSYFHVLSSGRLTDITDVTTLTTNAILPEAHTISTGAEDWWNTAIYGRELVRLMTEEGLFGVQENAVSFVAENVYSARLTLPSNAPPGPYLAISYVFRDGQIVARQSDSFAVRKIGFERFLALAAIQQPFFYGLICVVLALFTGWLGGVIFKR